MKFQRFVWPALVCAGTLPLLPGCGARDAAGEKQTLAQQSAPATQKYAPITPTAGESSAMTKDAPAAESRASSAPAADNAEKAAADMSASATPAVAQSYPMEAKKPQSGMMPGMPSGMDAKGMGGPGRPGIPGMNGGMPSSGMSASANPVPPPGFRDSHAVGSFGGSFDRTRRLQTHMNTLPSPTAVAKMAMAGQQQSAVYNPNMYVDDTYIGGNGEKDRLEKLIQAGVLVDGKRVKLEAFTHNYAQAFPIPQNTALNVSAEAVQSKIIQSGAHTYLQIGIQAMKGELPRRPPLNLALVIDRSGSMADEHKLEYAKIAAVKLVDSLTAEDTFSLVVFDNTVNVLVPAQRVTNKARIRSLIGQLRPGGSTNIYDALTRAYQQIHKNVSADAISRVILLSDGEVTAGVNDPQQFHHLAASEVDKDVQTSAVGVGVEFNEDLMLSLARDGKGNYHFLKDGADTQQVFARELDELTHVVAKDVKLRIQLAPGVGLIRVLGAQTLDATQTALVKKEEKKIDRKVAEELGIAANRQAAPEEPGIKMLIPAFYRGDSHIVMLEIKAPPQTAEIAGYATKPTRSPGYMGTCKLADVFIKYKDLAHPGNREDRATATVQYTPIKDEMIYSVNRNVKKNLLGFQTGEALTQAATLIDQGRIADAIQQVDTRRNVVITAAQEWQDNDLRRDGSLLDRYKAVLTQLNAHQQLAHSDFGQYLHRSLTYNGYQMTR